MRQISKRREDIFRGVKVNHSDIYLLDCESDFHRLLKCVNCSSLTAICEAKRSPARLSTGDIVDEYTKELSCNYCDGLLGTIKNEDPHRYDMGNNPMIELSGNVELVE